MYIIFTDSAPSKLCASGEFSCCQNKSYKTNLWQAVHIKQTNTGRLRINMFKVSPLECDLQAKRSGEFAKHKTLVQRLVDDGRTPKWQGAHVIVNSKYLWCIFSCLPRQCRPEKASPVGILEYVWQDTSQQSNAIQYWKKTVQQLVYFR